MSILFGDKEVIVTAPKADKGASDKKDAPYVAKKGRKQKRGSGAVAPVLQKEEG